ncbi:MAG: ChbG/HpnK family deacetylase [Bryobacteraceae bacterium]
MKQLVVTADDFGLSKGITDGILDAHRNGIVTRTSIMAAGTAFEYAAEQARLHPRLGLGLHLTLVEETAVSAPEHIPSLVDSEGRLPSSYSTLVKGVMLRRIRLVDIETEVRAQIEKCTRAGLRLTHIDSHQHVHTLPSILRIVLRVAEEHGIRRIRLPLDSPSRFGARGHSRFLAKSALCWIARYGADKVRNQGLFSYDRMTGLFESGALNEERLLNILDLIKSGTTELVCHPGKEDSACRENYAHWGYQWEEELNALTSPLVREQVRVNGIQLVQ